MTDRERGDALATLHSELLEREARLKRLIEQQLERERPTGRPVSTPRHDPTAGTGDPGPLKEREVQILRLVVGGHTDREIGAQLEIDTATVRNRLGRIYWKLGVVTRTHAAVRAIELGLSRPGPADEAWRMSAPSGGQVDDPPAY